MRLLKSICGMLVALSMIVISNNYSGVVSDVYGDTTEIYGLGDDGALIWYDDFSGNALDNTKWNNEGATGAGGYGNRELQDYEMNYCEVSNGNLIIKPQFQYDTQTAKNVTGSFYSTKLWTKNQFNFKYGKIEIRAKLPKGQGTWAAGWMLGTGSDGQWPACGEMDIFETTSESTKTIIPQSIHCKRFNGMVTSEGNKYWNTTVNTATSEYHTYGAIWNDKRITFTVDGVPSGTYDPSQYASSGDGTGDNNIWPFNNSAYLILNVAIGGTLGGNVTPSGWTMIDKNGSVETYQDKMYVDWVKVYKTKKGESETTTQNQTTQNESSSQNNPIKVDSLDAIVSENQVGIQWKETDHQKAIGQRYNIYLDNKIIASNVKGCSYIISNVAKGIHNVGVCAVLNGKESEITSKLIVISTEQTTINNKTIIAKNVSIRKVLSKKKALKVSWKKAKAVNGYQIQYSRKRSMKGAKIVTIKKASTTSKTIKRLKKKKKYYIRIRSFVLSNNKPRYSDWSSIKSKKTK